MPQVLRSHQLLRYIVQLDALRAVAILSVLCNHTLSPQRLLFKLSERVSGADVFFTISGFLITALLLRDRQAVAQQLLSTCAAFRNFFLKRALRLYPACFLLVAVDWWLTGAPAAAYVPYMNFTSNLVVARQQDWGRLPHLWTMAVEQQFYLAWPLVVLLLPRKAAPAAMALCVGVGLYSQHVLPPFPVGFGHVLPHACLDALGLGALLAWVVVERPQYFPQVYRGLGVLAVVSVALMGMAAWDGPMPLQQRTLVALVVAWLIAYFVARGDRRDGVVHAVFTWPLLRGIGRMSYGLYLFHTTVLYTAWPLLERLHRQLPFYKAIAYHHGLLLGESLLIVFALAWFSWHYLEQPLAKLGRRWVIKKHPRPVGLSPSLPVDALAVPGLPVR